MKLKLRSDFIDYYDHYFDLEGDTFQRFTRTKRTREQDFQLLQKYGFDVPIFGVLKSVKLFLPPQQAVVVYDDVYAHCGEGKRLVRIADANDSDLDKLCSHWIHSEQVYHIRLLAIGDWMAVLRYESDHPWMSNVGQVEVQIEYYGKIHHRKMQNLQDELAAPLLAVDGKYVNGNFIAFDLNTAPGLKGTGIEKILDPEEVVMLIKTFWTKELI